jgi:DNA-binding NtrC family response regulator
MALPQQPLLGLRVDHFRSQILDLLSELEAINRFEVPQIERGIDLKAQVRNFEIALIESALSITGGSQLEAARLLNLRRSTLHAKIKLYRINCRKSRTNLQRS